MESMNENDLLHVIIYGNKNLDDNMNISIKPDFEYQIYQNSERFGQPLC